MGRLNLSHRLRRKFSVARSVPISVYCKRWYFYPHRRQYKGLVVCWWLRCLMVHVSLTPLNIECFPIYIYKQPRNAPVNTILHPPIQTHKRGLYTYMYGLYMSCICPVHVLYMSCVCPVYVLYMSCICPVYVLYMSCICPVYVLYMSCHCMSCICPVYVLHMSCICPVYVLHMSCICIS